MDKSPEELYQERNKRINDAIQLKIPDRVPIEMGFSYFPAKYTGITCQAAWYDFDKWLDATLKTIADFAPDGVYYAQTFSPGKALEYIDPKQVKWPGHGVPPDHGHQAIEMEVMKADEYDAWLEDPSDYALRVSLPRTVGVLESFKMLPPLSSLGAGYFGAVALGEAFARPEVAAAIETLQKAGREMEKYRSKMATFNSEIEKLGFPVNGMGGGGAAFDQISDFLRGMQGAMIDMYRQPEKLLEALERLHSNTMRRIKSMPRGDGSRRVFMALHRGADGFMSLKQFEKFYWPFLKEVIIAIVNAGYIPGVFFEGNYTSRLEYLLELPKGKVLAHLDTTDIYKAKEILKGHLCIRGNVPPTLLQTGTVQDVKDYMKELIDVVGKDGGLVVCPRSSPEKAKPENLKTMIDFTKEYGVYN